MTQEDEIVPGGVGRAREPMKMPSLMLAGCVLLAATFCAALCPAATVVNTDFSKGDFQSLGWKPDGAWEIVTYPGEKNNPGPVARFPARTPAGRLTKTFGQIKNPTKLELSFDIGWGWGAADHSQATGVMLLDNRGNGYIFETQRAKATWAVQWAPVTGDAIPQNKNWASDVIDCTQPAIRDGGGMQRLTITRDIDGNWTFSGSGWNKGAGATVKFTDTTTTRFTRLVLIGYANTDEPAFNKVYWKPTKAPTIGTIWFPSPRPRMALTFKATRRSTSSRRACERRASSVGSRGRALDRIARLAWWSWTLKDAGPSNSPPTNFHTGRSRCGSRVKTARSKTHAFCSSTTSPAFLGMRASPGIRLRPRQA
jgi:hypothetical protein